MKRSPSTREKDGATSHTARYSMTLLREMFPNHVISKFGDINWPPRSPDLTAPDFFLRGYFKSVLFKGRPKTLNELKERITEEIHNINPEMTRATMLNVQRRAEECRRRNRNHL